MGEVDRPYKKSFRIVCQHCGSDKVSVEFEPGCVYTEYTSESDSYTLTCTQCGNRYELSDWECD